MCGSVGERIKGGHDHPRANGVDANLPGDNSEASVRVKLRSAAFEAETADVPATPASSNQEVVKTSPTDRGLRLLTTTFAPSLMNCLAAARPIPLVHR
jgi:hypothetical protein